MLIYKLKVSVRPSTLLEVIPGVQRNHRIAGKATHGVCYVRINRCLSDCLVSLEEHSDESVRLSHVHGGVC